VTSRARLLPIVALGLAAAVGAGYLALEPLREADAAAIELWAEIGELRDDIAVLEPGAAAVPAEGRASRAELLGRLDRAEREFTARREAIVRLAVLHLAIALAAATAAFWSAVALAGRGRGFPGRAARGSTLAAAAAAPLDSVRGEYVRSFIADSTGRLVAVTAAVARDFGRTRESFVGEPMSTLFAPAARETIESIIAEIGTARPSAQVDLQVGGEGTERRVRLRLHARFDEAGLVAAIVGEGRDLPPEPAPGAAGDTASTSGSPPTESTAERGPENGRRARRRRVLPLVPVRTDVSRLAGAPILVALHNPDERRLVAFLLGQVGARVTAVPDGDALLSALEGARAEPFVALLLEPNLPEIDGLAALRTLRERECPIPVVALVPGGDAHLEAACREAGCARTTRTPVDRRSLIAALAGAIEELDPAR